MAACGLRDPETMIVHKLYWNACETLDEAAYLVAVLNVETVRGRVAHVQSRGQQIARDFETLFSTLPIPLSSPADAPHTGIAAAEAERAVTAAPVDRGAAFTTARATIRAALVVRRRSRTHGCRRRPPPRRRWPGGLPSPASPHPRLRMVIDLDRLPASMTVGPRWAS